MRLLIICSIVASTLLSSESYANEKIIGTWRLKTFLRITEEGKKLPWCPGAFGLISYGKDGFMSASINCPKGTLKDAPSQAYGNKILYSGHYYIDDKGQVIHVVENSSHPTLIGKKLPRTVESVNEKTLVLTGNAAKVKGRFHIVWEKVEKFPSE